MTFVNNAQYPVWLAESYNTTTPTIALPPGSNWEIQPKGQTTLCVPKVWQGRFWPRTGCDFSLFGKSAKQCTTSSQCDAGDICYGGMCLAQCNPSSGKASKGGGTPFCQSSLALDNTDAFCLNLSGAKNNLGVCTFNPGVVCKTGDCLGLLQCYGTWDGRTATQTGQSPASLFEPSFTSQSGANFDMSLVSGYNVLMAINPTAKSSCTSSSANPACTSDLNATCPANLRVAQAPGKGGPIKCGSGTCPSGACVNNTCVLGCNDPCDQCTQRNPSALKCDQNLTGGEGTYEDMFCVKNTATKGAGAGVSMSSCNQGTPVCWGNADCLPGETCQTGVTGFPTGAGVCSPSKQAATDCTTKSDLKKECGGYHNAGYPDAINYLCASTGSGTNDVACVPGTTAQKTIVSGLGDLTTLKGGGAPLYTGCGGVWNPDWVSTATTAGGGTTPFYKTFAAACPHAYGWQYDDYSGGFSCTAPSTSPTMSFTITFGLSK